MKKPQYNQAAKEWVESFRGKPGIYAFYINEICVYVGKADCLASRIFQHFKKRKDLHEIGIYDLSEWLAGLEHEAFKCLLRFKEAVLIARLKPTENIKRPKLTPEAIHRMPIAAQIKLLELVPDLPKFYTPLDSTQITK